MKTVTLKYSELLRETMHFEVQAEKEPKKGCCCRQQMPHSRHHSLEVGDGTAEHFDHRAAEHQARKHHEEPRNA